MEKKDIVVRGILLAGLSFSIGRQPFKSDTSPPEFYSSVPPRIAMVLQPPDLSLDSFSLPDFVGESLDTLDNQPVLTLNTGKELPDRVIETLSDKKSGDVLQNVGIEIYHIKTPREEIWGLTVPVDSDVETAISVHLIVPEVENMNFEALVLPEVGQSEENLVDLDENDVEDLVQNDEVAIVLVQSSKAVEDGFNKFPNGAAIDSKEKEVAVKLTIELEGVIYSVTESLPQD